MKYKINKNNIIQKIDDEMVIFNSEESILYTLNESASYIFKKIKIGLDKEKIINQMARKYAIDKNKASKDTNSIIDSLLKKKIINK